MERQMRVLEARAENGNHQTILLSKTFGLGCATLKNSYSVAVRKNAEYPGERTPVIINAGECFVYISTSAVMFEGAPITFYELPDGRGFVHDLCPDTPQTKTVEIILSPKTPAEIKDLPLYDDLKSGQITTGKPNTKSETAQNLLPTVTTQKQR